MTTIKPSNANPLDENNVLQLQREVTFSTVRTIKEQLEQMPEKISIELNFSEVTKVDSSAISLIIFALQSAREKGSVLKILCLTDTLEKLMKLYGVDDFLIER